MRKVARPLVFTPYRDELEVVLLWEKVVFLAAAIDELDDSALVDAPAKNALVGKPIARLEDRQHPSVGGAQHEQLGVAVVAIEIGELAHERPLREEVIRRDLERRKIERPGRGLNEVVQRENVSDNRLRLEAKENVVAEYQLTADVANVTRHAVVLGSHPLSGEQRELRATERFDAPLIQLLGTTSKLLSLD